MTDLRDAPAAATAGANRPNPSGSFIWYELITPDLDGAKAFYDSVVGWTVEAGSAFPNGYRMIGRADSRNAGGVLPLTEEMRNHGARPVWLGYIDVDDVDATVAKIETDGGKVMMAASDLPEVGRIAMVTDPQGAPFYVMKPVPQQGKDEASDVFSVDQPQHVRWNELSTTDPDAAIAFYTRHFGWAQEGAMDMPGPSDAAGGVEGGEMGKYRFIQHAGVGIGAVMRKIPQMPVSLWTYYIGVDDIDRAAEAINSGGGTILNGPMEIPGGEHALNAMDPQGAAFGLVGPRKG